MNGKFTFKAMPDGAVDKTKVICTYCRCEMSYHRTTTSLKYHLFAKHRDHADSPVSPETPSLRLTTLDSVKGKPMNKHTSSKLSTAIAKWVATALRPLNIVEDKGLREIIRIASNDYTYELPSRATTLSTINSLYEDQKTTVAEELGKATAVALTGDYWTSLSHQSYLEVTAHYFDKHWELRSHALAVITEDRHFAEHFMLVAKQWNIERKVSTLGTDRARNMIAANTQLPFEHLSCAAHSLQRSITASLQNSSFDTALAKCRKVVGHFRHSPPNAAELEQQQIANGQEKEALTHDVPTRWNSTLEMIKRVLRNQQPLRAALALQTTTVAMPTTPELEKLQRLETVLEHCRYVTELLGGEKFVSCSVVLPAWCHISRVMEVCEDDPACTVTFKQTFITAMQKHKENSNRTWLGIGTALDPRFKDLKCLHRLERAEVWASVSALLGEVRPVEPERPATSDLPSRRAALMMVLESESEEEEEEEDSTEKCVARYRAEPPIGMEDCPRQWWARHEGAHSELARLARTYLATPATSVPCDRLFGLGGQRKRAALSPGNVHRLVCLSNWLGAQK